MRRTSRDALSKPDKGCDELYLDVTEKTLIFRKVGEEQDFSQAEVADLKRDRRVRAEHTGVLTKSHPGQGSAKVIVKHDTDAASEPTAPNSGSLR